MIRPGLLPWIAAWAMAAPAGAQAPATISGRVVDRETRHPVEAAEIRLGDQWRLVRQGGRFTIAVEPGLHYLEIRAVGYATAEREVRVLPGQGETVIVALVPAVAALDSIVITASRLPAITGDELRSRGGDLPTALNGWQGIVVTRTGQGDEAIARIRGSAADEVLVLVDGFALNDPFTGRADLARLAVQDVEQITMAPGAQNARAGSRAVAGVIEIRTRHRFAPEAMVGAGSAGTVQARMAASAGRVSAALMVQSLPDDYRVDVPSGGEARRNNAGGEIWTLNARARAGVDLVIRGSFSDRGLPGTTVNPTPAARTRDRALLLGMSTGAATWARASLEFLDTRSSDDAPPPGFVAYRAHTHGWGSTVETGLRGRHSMGSWTAGTSLAVDARHDRFRGDAVRDNASFSRAGASAGLELHRPGKAVSWRVAPIVRADWFTGQDGPLASARMDLEMASKGTSATAAFGNGVTVPALADLLFRDAVGVAINPDLRPERVRWEAELGVSQEFSARGHRGTLRLGGFYGVVDDMILWTPNFRFVWSPGNFGVRRRGVEGSLDLGASRGLRLHASAALTRTSYDTRGGGAVPYRPEAMYALSTSWSPGPWRFSLGWNYLGARYSRNRETQALPGFGLVTAGVSRRVGQVVLRGEVRDLTDARPMYIAGFPTPGRTVHLSINLELP